MLMKKFLGASAREAMQKMKAELGPDALVISNRKTAAGVEILAMVEGAHEAPPAHRSDEPAHAAFAAAATTARAAPGRGANARSGASPAGPAGRRDPQFTSLKDFAQRIEAPAPVPHQQRGMERGFGSPRSASTWDGAATRESAAGQGQHPAPAALQQAACCALPRLDDPLRALLVVQTQIRFLLFAAMAIGTMRDKNRLNVAYEIHFGLA